MLNIVLKKNFTFVILQKDIPTKLEQHKISGQNGVFISTH